ncbi:hypothetical protein B0H67DRAFT_642410 [Lasiosphaeris hirsuta]|uniref:Uncharacterized protein n=1 Tax=Lasiosphaeris hirsuta TaxID=260670 RepID=A0AA40B1T1_9PEZI|nr:hypothetical protein B0H67DRAFT_642410 [Lasiosphaeris hirsuta]
MKHPKRFSNSTIMSLIYGTRTPTIRSKHMVKLYDLMENWSKVMEAAKTPAADIFPFLKYVPEQFLGMWRSRAQDWVEYVITWRKDSSSRDVFINAYGLHHDPKRFPCTITLRSEERGGATILRESDKAAAEIFSRYETPKE